MSSHPTLTPNQTNQQQQPTKKPSTLTALAILTLLFAISIAFFLANLRTEEPRNSPTATLFGLKRFFSSTSPVSREVLKTASDKTGDKMSRTPIYFLSHGGVSYDPIHMSG
ncbi:hypothetical protein BDV23DRAFT_43437 [Aspergillus alliaceus]|uniref:Uncharacterized protein n=1 Tax=Petromyces alliaceus TaxID=209559 RepID=A0A5N7BQP4_PETAA|nr:hypothetical protein BDV23DRAFT_43437 [Aspergillus alliaceus]